MPKLKFVGHTGTRAEKSLEDPNKRAYNEKLPPSTTPHCLVCSPELLVSLDLREAVEAVASSQNRTAKCYRSLQQEHTPSRRESM